MFGAKYTYCIENPTGFINTYLVKNMQFDMAKAGLGAAYGIAVGMFAGLIVAAGIGISGITTVASIPTAVVFPGIVFSAVVAGALKLGIEDDVE